MAINARRELNRMKFRLSKLESQLSNVDYQMKSVVKAELVESSTVMQKSENRFGLYTALCVTTLDPWKQNRIRWFCPFFMIQNYQFLICHGLTQ